MSDFTNFATVVPTSGDSVYECPFPRCPWSVTYRPPTVDDARVEPAPGESFQRFLSRAANSALDAYNEQVEVALRQHLDGWHPKWNMDQLQKLAVFRTMAIRARVALDAVASLRADLAEVVLPPAYENAPEHTAVDTLAQHLDSIERYLHSLVGMPA